MLPAGQTRQVVSFGSNCSIPLLLCHASTKRKKMPRRQELTFVGAVTTLPPLAFVSLTAIA